MNKNIIDLIEKFNSQTVHVPIDKYKLEQVVDILFAQLFPICESPDHGKMHKNLVEVAKILFKNISNITNKEYANKTLMSFFEQFPIIQQQLYEDAQCYLDNDPAAKSLDEVVLTYPGFYALCIYRLANILHQLGVPLIPRLFTEHVHSKVGIDIHPAAKIGNKLFMDHGTGIVIGETTVLGNNVKIYQGVTLGALLVEKKLANVKRHPTVEDNVVIYANATILGGETVIGHDSTIGGGAWLTQSVIPFSLVYNSVDVKIRTVKDFIQPIDFSI